jgi:protocatechuate 3,4-dioxygenase beta subunit
MKTLLTWTVVLAFAFSGRARAADSGPPDHYTGTAVDGQGRPVAGATVESYQDSSPAAANAAPDFALKERGVTGSNGSFTVSAGGGTTIVVLKKDGLAPAWSTFTPALGQSSQPLLLTAPTSLAGMVVDDKGRPVPDAEVWVSLAVSALQLGDSVQRNTILGKPARDCFSARTDADGRFRLTNFPANSQANLAARKSGLGKRVPVSFSTTSAYSSGDDAIKLTLDRPASIEGRVTVEGTGQPLSGVALRWLGAAGGLSDLDAPDPVLSDANGSFRIADAASGTAALSAVFPGEPLPDWVAEEVPLTLASGEGRKGVQVVAVKGGVAVISVLSQDERQPLANVNMAASLQSSDFSLSTATGTDGTARLRLPPGTWVFTAGKEGWNNGHTVAIISTGLTNQVSLFMNPVLRITGLVRDPAGAPVAGAFVFLSRGSGEDSGVKTDSQGRYELRRSLSPGFPIDFNGFGGLPRSSSYLVAQSADRNLLTIHVIDDDTTNLDLRLKSAVTITAKVVDDTGKPLANAIGTASAANANNAYAGPGPAASASDALGRLIFTGLAQADSYSVSVSAKGYGTRSQQVPAPDRQTNRFEFPPFVLRPANRLLAGVVLGPDGKPVPAANINIQGQGQSPASTTSDTDGRFIFSAVCSGTVEIFAGFRGAGNDYLNANSRAQGGDTHVVIHFTANTQGPNDRLVTNSGTVLDPSGAPVAGARLRVFPNYGAEITSDKDGKYYLVWQNENNGVTPFLLVHHPDRQLTYGRELDASLTNLDFRLQPALTLSIKLRDSTGKPVPAARVGLDVVTKNGWSFSFQPGSVLSDDQGVVEFKDMPEGQHYRVGINANGFGMVSIEAQSEQTATNRFDFPVVVLKTADHKLAGQVLGPDGKPVPRVYVVVQGDGQVVTNTRTDAQGRFAFDAVCEGLAQLFAQNQKDGSGASLTAQGGDTNVVIRFAAKQPGGANNRGIVAISGTVFDPSGVPVPGLRLSVASQNTDVRSDDDGKYSIEWNSGNGRNPYIYARDAADDLAVSRDLDPATTNLDLHLQPALTLRANVQDAGGKPVRTATAALSPFVGDMQFSYNRPLYQPDDHGLIEIRGLPPGRRYRLFISAAGFGTADLLAREADTRTTRFEFTNVILKTADRKIAGRVLGPDGAPVPGARVGVQDHGQPLDNITADTNGYFCFEAVCEGPAQLYANGRVAGGNLNAGAQVQGGDTNVVIHLGGNH